jgi:hypothetical protein
MFYGQLLPDEPEVKGDEPRLQSHLPASSFEPRLWRYLCFGFLLFALFVIFVSAVVGYITGRPLVLLYTVIASMVVAAVNYRSLVTSVSVLSIEVNATSISGPGEVPIYSGGRSSRTSARQTILLAELDRARSAKRTPVNRLLGRQYLYSTSGDRIYLARRSFARSDICRLFAQLRLDPH